MPQSEVVVGCQKVFADNLQSMSTEAINRMPDGGKHAASQVQVQSFECESMPSDFPALASSFSAESNLLPQFEEQEINFLFLNFFMTIIYQNNKTVMRLRPAPPPTHNMWLLYSLKTRARRKTILHKFKFPKLLIAKQGRPNPLYQSQN